MAKLQNRIVGSAVKNIGLGEFDAWIKQQIETANGGGDLQEFYKSVPWLFRGVALRAYGIAGIPFSIMRGETEIATSTDWDSRADELEWFDDPEGFLILTESALTLTGCAYWGKLRNRLARASGGIDELCYYAPPTISPVLDETDGLIGFKRKLSGSSAPQELAVEDVLYFWYLDPFVEIAQPRAFPAQAALRAAGVMLNLDEFVAKFFKSGAIKATIYQVESNLTDDQKKSLKERIDAFMAGGIKNAFSSLIFQKGAIAPLVVGDGVKDLENSTLSGEKREDIAAALNIPQTILFSGSAAGLGGGGVIAGDDIRFATQFKAPEANFLTRVLNKQVFSAMGLRFAFNLNALKEFQEDENARAASIAQYTNVLATPKQARIAFKIMGIDLTPELQAEIDALIEEKAANAAQIQANIANAQAARRQDEEDDGEDKDDAEDAETEKDKEAKAFKRWMHRRGAKADPAQFKFSHHDADAAKALIAEARGAQAERPFPITLDALKAVPLVDDAVRRAAEDALCDKIAATLKKYNDEVIAQIEAGEAIDWDSFERKVKLIIETELASSAQAELARLGGAVGFDFDPTRYDEAARQWARQYSYSLIRDMTENTRKVVQDAMTKFTEGQGMTRGALQDLLKPAFGDVRASAIAVTETTRAYSQAQTIYKDLLAGEGVTMERVWHTVKQEVCKVCNSLDGQIENAQGLFHSDLSGQDYRQPPDPHVNCRCFIGLRLRRE
jgi:hypothetical protein